MKSGVIFAFAATAAIGLASCNVVESTHAAKVAKTPQSLTCSGGLGAYKLSRSLLAASITYTGGPNGATGPEFNGLAVTHTHDNDHQYCLGYDGSAFSADIVRVAKTKDETLSVVTSRTLDQSRFVIQSFVQLLFTAITRSPTADIRSAALNGATELKYANEFDPFDYRDTAEFNGRAKDFGFCVFIPEYAFDLRRTTISDYCEDPVRVSRMHPPIWKQELLKTEGLVTSGTYPKLAPVADEKHLKGVLYRPRFAYTVYLMNKQGTDWVIQSRGTAMMENVSPILSVDLPRPVLAERATALQFNNGTLTKICSYNSAGVVEFVEIPLSIARAIIQIPAQILSVRVGSTRNDIALAETEAKLAQTQLQLLQLEEGATSAPGNPGQGRPPQAVGAFDQGEAGVFGASGDKIVTKPAGALGEECPAIAASPAFGPQPVSEVPGFGGGRTIVRAPSLNRR